MSEAQRAHLRNALSRAREFRQLLVRKEQESFQYPPLAVLASDTRLTLSTVVRGGPHAVRGWDFRTAPKKPGDGRVEYSSVLPPQEVPYKVYRTSREHADLLNDTHQIAVILAQLGEECQ